MCFTSRLNVFKQLLVFIESGNLFHNVERTYERLFCSHVTFLKRNLSLAWLIFELIQRLFYCNKDVHSWHIRKLWCIWCMLWCILWSCIINCIDSLSANPTKSSNTLKQFVGKSCINYSERGHCNKIFEVKVLKNYLSCNETSIFHLFYL